MAENLRDIRRRIRSVESTQKITQAMKMVAAAKLRRAQERAEASRPYAQAMRDVLTEVASRMTGGRNPLLKGRPVRRVGYVVITGDRGLAGSYNAAVIRQVQQDQAAREERRHPLLFVVGRKGREYFRHHRYEIKEAFTHIGDEPDYALAAAMGEACVKAYLAEEVDQVRLVFSRFVTAMTQRPTVEILLPLTPPQGQGEERGSRPSGAYLFEPDEETVLDLLVPQYIMSLLYGAFLEAKASEHGARMTAMDSATKAANDLIRQLILQRNRARQAAITKEIAEIVGGAAALE